jgi:hypothetical protein
MAAIGAVNTLVGHHLKPDDMFLAFLFLNMRSSSALPLSDM